MNFISRCAIEPCLPFFLALSLGERRAFTKINPRPNPRLNPRPAAQFRVAAFAAPRYAGGESALNLQPARVGWQRPDDMRACAINAIALLKLL